MSAGYQYPIPRRPEAGLRHVMPQLPVPTSTVQALSVSELRKRLSCASTSEMVWELHGARIAGLDNGVVGYFETALGLSTTNPSSGSGSGMAIAPERRCGFGFSGARTGLSGSSRVGGSLPESAGKASAYARATSSIVSWFSSLASRLRLSRPFPINTYAALSKYATGRRIIKIQSSPLPKFG